MVKQDYYLCNSKITIWPVPCTHEFSRRSTLPSSQPTIFLAMLQEIKMLLPTFSLLLLCISSAISVKNDDPNYAERKRLTENLLSKSEAPHMQLRPPTPTGTPLNVTVNIYIRDIYDIDEDRNRFTVQLTMRQEWTDNRLAYTPTSADFKYFLFENIGHDGPPVSHNNSANCVKLTYTIRFS